MEKVIELVRREEVVLWLGSGFSLYAGFPNGNKLASTIYQALTPTEQQEVSPHMSLMDLSEAFVRLKSNSRNELNQLLRKQFLTTPTSLKWHEVMASIPHFKTIITTNYDRLIETAYQGNITTIWKESELSYVEKDKPELFKIHGDILTPESIVLTRTDYRLFTRNIINNSNLIWSAIKSRIANKAIVFIGYDLEDDNIKELLDEIAVSLGSNQKEIFLLAPNFRDVKIQYLRNFNIQYIDTYAETFFEKLDRAIKDNIVSDFEKKKISPETFRKFMAGNSLEAQLTANRDRFRIDRILPGDPSVKEELSVKLLWDKKVSRKLSAMKNGEDFSSITIDGSLVKELKILMNDINITGEDPSNYRLTISHPPYKVGKATLVFSSGNEFEDVGYQLYRSQKLFELRALYKGATYQLTFASKITATKDGMVGKFLLTAPDAFANVNDAIKIYTLALCFGQAESCNIFLDNITTSFPFNPQAQNMPIERLQYNLTFFNNLKKIEQHYAVRFEHIDKISDDDFINADKAIFFASGGIHTQQTKGKIIYGLEGKDNLLKVIAQPGVVLTREAQFPEELTILGKKITLGYQIVEIPEPYVSNLDAIENGTATQLELAPKDGNISIRYVKEIRKELLQGLPEVGWEEKQP